MSSTRRSRRLMADYDIDSLSVDQSELPNCAAYEARYYTPHNKNGSRKNVNCDDTDKEGGYEEFFHDTVPCLVCHGIGTVHRDEEKKLVAMIPLTDKRLRPRRTFVHIFVTLLACCLIGGLFVFFITPRSVVVTSHDHLLFATKTVVARDPKLAINITISKCYHFNNRNFYSVRLHSIEVSVGMNGQFGYGNNYTHYTVEAKSRFVYCAQVTIMFSQKYDYVVKLCMKKGSYSHTLYMRFRLIASYEVLGQKLQTVLVSKQFVDCGIKHHNGTNLTTTARYSDRGVNLTLSTRL